MGTEAFQESDTCAITAPCTKKNYLVMSAEDLAPTIYEAFRLAQDGRPGPTLVDIPRDVQQEVTEFNYLGGPTGRCTGTPVRHKGQIAGGCKFDQPSRETSHNRGSRCSWAHGHGMSLKHYPRRPGSR